MPKSATKKEKPKLTEFKQPFNKESPKPDKRTLKLEQVVTELGAICAELNSLINRVSYLQDQLSIHGVLIEGNKAITYVSHEDIPF